MARYELVEGKSSKFWEVVIEGASLVVSFGRIGTTGQRQVKTFATSELARKERDRLVAEKTKKGYAPAAGEGPPSDESARKDGVTIPGTSQALRRDLYVYNEATGFAVTSKRLGGKGLDGGSAPWHKAVRAGDLIPVELTQDDSFIIRVVVGGPLEPQEAEEWVGRLDWKLRVPDGDLVVCGGAEYVMEEFEGEESEYMSEYVRHVEIPRGEYRATVYMYFGGVNGRSCLGVAREGDEPDPLGEWFRATRPDQPFPAWLHNACVADPAEDPGHEGEWKKAKPIEGPAEHFIDFLLHLQPLAAGEKVTMPEISTEGGEDGWFCQPFACRVPDRIPLGILAPDPDGLKKDDAASAPQEEQPIPVQEHTARFELAPVNGKVEVPLARLDRLYRLAWFCHAWSIPRIVIEPPAGGARLPVIDAQAEGVRVHSEPEALRLEFLATGRQGGALRGLAAVLPRLEGFPDGSTVALEAANIDPEALKKPRPFGLHRYTGTIENGVVTITRAFPVQDAARLEAALALSAQVETGTIIDAGDPGTAAAALRSLKQHPYFEDNPAVARGETGIALEKPDPMLLAVVASEVFHKAFKKDFPLFDFDADEEEDEGDDEDVPVFPSASRGSEPPIGAELLRGNRGRVFHASDAGALGPDAARRITEAEKVLRTLGFTHVADIVCKPLQTMLLRGYAQEGGTTWAAMLISSHGRSIFDFVSTFERGASLLTTENKMVRDELHRDAYKTVHAAGDLSALWAHHQRRAQHLAEFHGPPAKVDATPKGLAATVERAFQRQEEARPGAGKTSLLEADDHTYFAADARIIHPDVPRLVDDADARMRSLGFVHVGDVVGTFLTDCLVRGYARQGGDAWALLQINASTIHPPAASWDFVTRFEKGAVLSSTRGALSKDEPKRKIFRILDATASPEELLARHDARKGELAKKWGAPVAVTADMKTLAAEVADIVRRFIG